MTPRKSCADVRRRANEKIREIDGRIAAPKRMKRALEHLSAACADKAAMVPCPILDAPEMLEAGR